MFVEFYTKHVFISVPSLYETRVHICSKFVVNPSNVFIPLSFRSYQCPNILGKFRVPVYNVTLCIEDILDKNGMTCFHTNSYNDKSPVIHKKILRIFHQEAFSTLTDEKSKLRTYGIIKKEIGTEKY